MRTEYANADRIRECGQNARKRTVSASPGGRNPLADSALWRVFSVKIRTLIHNFDEVGQKLYKVGQLLDGVGQLLDEVVPLLYEVALW